MSLNVRPQEFHCEGNLFCRHTRYDVFPLPSHTLHLCTSYIRFAYPGSFFVVVFHNELDGRNARGRVNTCNNPYILDKYPMNFGSVTLGFTEDLIVCIPRRQKYAILVYFVSLRYVKKYTCNTLLEHGALMIYEYCRCQR